jgi:hypothetical protein
LFVLVPGALLLVHFTLLAGGVWNKSATVDEFVHVPAGCYYWKTGDFSLSGVNPPLLRLWSTLPLLLVKHPVPFAHPPSQRSDDYPWKFGEWFMNWNWDHYDRLMTLARVSVMLLSVVTGWVLFVWARRRYGVWAGLTALGLFVIEPNVLAHGGLATLDTGMMLAFVLTLFFLDRFLQSGAWWRVVVMGVCLAAACLVKFSGLVVAAGVATVFLLSVLRGRPARFDVDVPGEGRFREGRRRLVYQSAVILPAVALVVLAVINAEYGFAGSFQRLGGSEFRSAALQGLARSPLGLLPVPLPREYIRGLDGQQWSVEQGETVNYLNGRWSETGWWYYYLEAFLLKVPLPHLLLMGLGAVSVLLVRTERRDGAWMMVTMGVVYWALHSFGSNKNIGLRYMLPIFPLCCILAGRSMLLVARFSGVARKVCVGVIVLLAAWGATESLRIFPDYLAYFNQAAGGPEGGPRYLLDSNIDWGQDLKGFADYLKTHQRYRDTPVYLAYFGYVYPEHYGIKPGKLYPGARGIVAISVNLLYGLPQGVNLSLGMPYGVKISDGKLYGDATDYVPQLLRSKPLAVIGHTIYVYRTDK